MLHEKPVRYGPLGGDVEGTNMAWKREKRRRKHLTQSSSSDARTATAQGHQAPIPYVRFGPDNAAKDHQGPISDMAIVQAQDHELLQERSDWGQQEEGGEELFGPDVILSEEDQARDAQKLLPNIRPPIDMYSMCWIDNRKVKVRQGRYRIAYYKAMNPESGRKLKDPDAYSEDEIVNQTYFKHLEDDFEWFFHTDDSWIPDLGDYERIVLKNVIHCITREHVIDINTEDEKARDLFRMGVAGIKKKNMVKYAEKRMEIGERLNLHKRIEIPGPGRKH